MLSIEFQDLLMLVEQTAFCPICMPPYGRVEGVWESVFKQTSQVLVHHGVVHILNDLLDQVGLEGTALRGRSLEGEFERAFAVRATRRGQKIGNKEMLLGRTHWGDLE